MKCEEYKNYVFGFSFFWAGAGSLVKMENSILLFIFVGNPSLSDDKKGLATGPKHTYAQEVFDVLTGKGLREGLNKNINKSS